MNKYWTAVLFRINFVHTLLPVWIKSNYINILKKWFDTLQVSVWKGRYYCNAGFRQFLEEKNTMKTIYECTKDTYFCSFDRTIRIDHKLINFRRNNNSIDSWLRAHGKIANIVFTKFVSNIKSNTRTVTSIWKQTKKLSAESLWD